MIPPAPRTRSSALTCGRLSPGNVVWPGRRIETGMRKYAWDAREYIRASAEQQKWGRELLGKLALRGEERVLDIGCGDGRITAKIARQLPEGFVTGIDNSENMIAFARGRYDPDAYPNLRFRTGNARSAFPR